MEVIAKNWKDQLCLTTGLFIHYKLASPLSSVTFGSDKTLRLFTELSTLIIFHGFQGLGINIWFLSRGKKVAFRQGLLDAFITEKDPIRA